MGTTEHSALRTLHSNLYCERWLNSASGFTFGLCQATSANKSCREQSCSGKTIWTFGHLHAHSLHTTSSEPSNEQWSCSSRCRCWRRRWWHYADQSLQTEVNYPSQWKIERGCLVATSGRFEKGTDVHTAAHTPRTSWGTLVGIHCHWFVTCPLTSATDFAKMAVKRVAKSGISPIWSKSSEH